MDWMILWPLNFDLLVPLLLFNKNEDVLWCYKFPYVATKWPMLIPLMTNLPFQIRGRLIASRIKSAEKIAILGQKSIIFNFLECRSSTMRPLTWKDFILNHHQLFFFFLIFRAPWTLSFVYLIELLKVYLEFRGSIVYII